MKGAHTLVFVLLLITLVSAQRPDSLWQIHQDHAQSDSMRCAALHSLARLYMFKNPDSSLYYADIELEFASTVGDSMFIASAHNMQGGAYLVKGDYIQALNRFNAFYDMQMARRDSNGIASALNNIGNTYYYMGDFSRALQYYSRSQEMEEALGKERGLSISLINIGSIYAQLAEHDKALERFKRALVISEKLNDRNGMGICNHNIGNTYADLNKLDEAHMYLTRSIPLLRESENHMSLATTYANLADVYLRQGDPDLAMEFLRRSEELRTSLGDQVGLARSAVSRGLVYLELDRFREARKSCEDALARAESLRALPEMRDACDCLYKTHKGLNQNETALRYFERYTQLLDSVNMGEARSQLQVMEFRKQVAEDSIRRTVEKQAIAEQHASQLKREGFRRNVLISSGLVLLIASLFLYRNMRKVRSSKQKIEAEKVRTDELLLNMLPADVTREILSKGRMEAREFEHVAILFTDFIEFSAASQSIAPKALIAELNQIFREFDNIIVQHGIMKIKSMGDAYLAAGGLPVPSQDSTKQTVLAAIEMQEYIEGRSRSAEVRTLKNLHMRVGVHEGPVIAGVVGSRNFQYDVWGDTVNIASRLEGAGVSGKVNVSRSVYERLHNDPELQFEPRGLIEIKGKGLVEMWFAERSMRTV